MVGRQRSVEHYRLSAASGDVTLAPILGARRDGSVTAPSTRGLLVTVLGELVRPTGGQVWTQSLLEVLELFDIEPKAARQAIARLAREGWLESDRFGRRTRWRLTPWADALLASGAERIYGFGQRRTEWDRQWLLAMVRVPEAQRRLRYRLEVGLGWAGFGTAGQGVWLSPWTDRETEAARLLVELGVENPVIFRAELGAIGDGAEVAGRAWDLPRVAAEYADFIDSVPGRARVARCDGRVPGDARAPMATVPLARSGSTR